MNIPTEILLWCLTLALSIIGFFLSRILNRISTYEEKLNTTSMQVALNVQDITRLKRSIEIG